MDLSIKTLGFLTHRVFCGGGTVASELARVLPTNVGQGVFKSTEFSAEMIGLCLPTRNVGKRVVGPL